ncbi:MAG: polyprenyl synthetase family protein [Elusimicrobia bacterium]|nr:polyprenyl synthetase family protein [Elusimicrobiota bacterium]MBU2615395.1 polyprenyl synthetase family protein [Elusimicrobiota bacterium]
MKKIEDVLNSWKNLIDKSLKYYLTPKSKDFNQQIYDAMIYSVFPGGKRIRPILTLASAKACGLPEKDVLPAACAIEIVHSYSLIHDDLPSMDNAPLRRGKPTVHKKFNEGLAVLAGDALLTKAFELCSDNAKNTKVKPAQAIKAISALARAAGDVGMIGGQVADTFGAHKNLDRKKRERLLDYIHTHKTGDLIEVSVLLGGILAGVNEKKLKALKSYGRKIGLAFQVVDDIFDSEEDADKLTYPNFYGLDNSRKLACQLISDAKKELKLFGPKANILSSLADFVIQRKS